MDARLVLLLSLSANCVLLVFLALSPGKGAAAKLSAAPQTAIQRNRDLGPNSADPKSIDGENSVQPEQPADWIAIPDERAVNNWFELDFSIRHQGILRAFGLSEEEVASIEASLNELYDRIKEEELASAKVVVNEDGSAALVIPRMEFLGRFVGQCNFEILGPSRVLFESLLLRSRKISLLSLDRKISVRQDEVAGEVEPKVARF
jgi:hypothetical protein